MLQRLGLSLVLLTSLAAAVVHAEPAALSSAKSDYEHGEFLAALALLTQAQMSPELTEEGLAQVHWLRGACFHALGKHDEASAAFDELLRLRPLFMPNPYETPPDLRDFFGKKAEAYQSRFGVWLDEMALDESASLHVTMAGPGSAARVVVFARAPGEASYKRFDMPVADAIAVGRLGDVALWEKAGAAGLMELVVEARNAGDVPVARNGDALKPITVAVTAEQAAGSLALLKTISSPPPKRHAVRTAAKPRAPRPAWDGETPSPARKPLLYVGAGALVAAGGAGAVGVVAMLLGALSGALAGGIYYYIGNVPGSGRNFSTLSTAYTAAVPVAGLLLGGAALLVVVGVACAIGGAGVLIARMAL